MYGWSFHFNLLSLHILDLAGCRFQLLLFARGGTAQRKIFHLLNWSQLIHPGPSSSRSSFFMELSQSCVATLTHDSTESLTTGPDYDPLLLLLAMAGDVYPNPGPPRYPCSVCFKNVTSQGTSYLCTRRSHWVHSRCSGLRKVADYHRANGWICTACRTPPQPRAPSTPPSPAYVPTISVKIIQYSPCTPLHRVWIYFYILYTVGPELISYGHHRDTLIVPHDCSAINHYYRYCWVHFQSFANKDISPFSYTSTQFIHGWCHTN